MNKLLPITLITRIEIKANDHINWIKNQENAHVVIHNKKTGSADIDPATPSV